MFRSFLVGLIRFYRRAISPWTPAACRFQPTCSAYALEAVERHGALRGSALAVKRLLRCHPWGGSGYDPVPGSGRVPPEEEGSGVIGRTEACGTTTPADGGAGAPAAAGEPRKTKAMRNP